MVGITSYGTYIPMLRLPLATVAGSKACGPEKAVADIMTADLGDS